MKTHMRAIALPLATLPDITVAGRFPLTDRSFATRYLSSTHALHLHDYAARMRLGGAEVAIAPGDVTISPAGEASGYDLGSDGRHWCVHFDMANGGTTFEVPLHIPRRDFSAVARERMAEIATLHGQRADSATAGIAASLALQQLLLWLYDCVSDAPARYDPAEAAARVIEERFQEPLGVAAIAAMVGRSSAHLARVFRARYGVTIPHRLIQRRAEHARYLLESTDLPIWRVAERAGIPDAQLFNKTLRRVLGASPSAIRARAPARALIDPDR